ncbi:hypothetical protein [Actinoplanes cyaneus]|nr:hypothetical protein [Actinoplanes cyaneus]
MRKCLLVPGVLLALAACGSTPSPVPVVSSRVPASTGATVPTSSPPPAATPPSGSRRPEPSPGTSRGDPDNPVDRVGAPIVLTGTVGNAGGCVVLTVNGRRWALVGAAAARLAGGQTATVRGRPVPVPADCDAAAALAVDAVR